MLNLENLDGVLSLLFACIELVLIINLLIFAEKNSLNKLIILNVTLLLLYQFIEFLICFEEFNSSLMVYFAFSVISFLPPLSLLIVFSLYEIKNRILPLIFLPALFFLFYYPLILKEFVAVKCTVLYATYNYPLGDIFGAFYYLPILVSIVLLIFKLKIEADKKRKKLGVILLTGLLITFTPAVILVLFIPGFVDVIESIMCKLAIFIALAFSFAALINKSEVNDAAE